jgi:hypothetical protein
MYGAAEWQALRRTVTDPDLLNHESKDHRLTYDLYPIYEFPIIDTPDWKGLAPDPMNYNGFLIMGVYNKSNNEGFGRVVSFEEISYLKLLWHYGFELFPFWKGQPARRRFRGYLFPITKGPGETITVGKQLAMLPKPDNAHPELDTAYVTGSTSMKVVFNEPVTKESAEDTANYHVSRGMNVLSASLQADQKTVLLTTTPLLNNTNFKLSVYNIMDLSQNTADYLWTYTPTSATYIGRHPGLKTPALAVSPNPVQQGGKVTFALPQPDATNLGVCDIRGISVGAISKTGKGFCWDTRAVPEGIYYYRMGNSIGKLMVIE